ncbi:MAG TPA: hypothetical protein VE641_16645, partial [Chthoniobacterales bacterium]|nr:hypothetical protein [Chthoniobacterales bacterium]
NIGFDIQEQQLKTIGKASNDAFVAHQIKVVEGKASPLARKVTRLDGPEPHVKVEDHLVGPRITSIQAKGEMTAVGSAPKPDVKIFVLQRLI